MKIISNASPIINLARIGHLALLQQLYGQIVIPSAVWQEVVIGGSGRPGAADVESATWITCENVANTGLVRALRQDLDAGEAEAIALALETEADLLLMDERIGRETAHHLGLRHIGLVGILVEAKRRRILTAVSPVLIALREQAGFRLDDALYARIRTDEKEED